MNKDQEIADALGDFFNQFGSMDLYTQIVLEELLKELLNESKSNIHIPSEKR